MTVSPFRIAILGCIGVIAGALLALFIPQIRYTDRIEPMVRDESPTLLREIMKQHPEDYLFIDVRPNSDYAKLHAEGSINIPIHLFYDKRHEFPKTDKTIVLVCTGGRLSGVAYSYLEHYGFTNIVRVGGGLEAWQAEKQPVILGDLIPS